MKVITLKEFCNMLGYYPHTEKNLSAFAKLVGISISYVSKLYNAHYVGTFGPKWIQLCKFVESYGYQLVPANTQDFFVNNLTRENKKLKTQIKKLENIIVILESQLTNINDLVKLSTKIIKTQNDIKEVKKNA